MSLPAVVDTNAFEHIAKIAELTTQGKKPMAISKELGIPFAKVKEGIEQWHEIMQSDAESKDIARDYLNRMVSHYDDLIEKSYANLKNLNNLVFDEKVSAQINATLKNISEYESKRVDALQKAGLLDAHDLGDDLARREEEEQKIIEILNNDLCPSCTTTVATKLQILKAGDVEAQVVYDD